MFIEPGSELSNMRKMAVFPVCKSRSGEGGGYFTIPRMSIS